MPGETFCPIPFLKPKLHAMYLQMVVLHELSVRKKYECLVTPQYGPNVTWYHIHLLKRDVCIGYQFTWGMLIIFVKNRIWKKEKKKINFRRSEFKNFSVFRFSKNQTIFCPNFWGAKCKHFSSQISFLWNFCRTQSWPAMTSYDVLHIHVDKNKQTNKQTNFGDVILVN